VADFLEKAPASETAPYILEGMSVKPPDAGAYALASSERPGINMGIATGATKPGRRRWIAGGCYSSVRPARRSRPPVMMHQEGHRIAHVGSERGGTEGNV
jgi:hypothetical protein